MGSYTSNKGLIRVRFILDPDPVSNKRLDPDPVNIRPDPQPCQRLARLSIFVSLVSPHASSRATPKKTFLEFIYDFKFQLLLTWVGQGKVLEYKFATQHRTTNLLASRIIFHKKSLKIVNTFYSLNLRWEFIKENKKVRKQEKKNLIKKTIKKNEKMKKTRTRPRK